MHSLSSVITCSLDAGATYISDKEATDTKTKQVIQNGEFQVIFFSPEALLGIK